ncbi:hypothetical protein ACJX0J_017583, partial [Zea mays]
SWVYSTIVFMFNHFLDVICFFLVHLFVTLHFLCPSRPQFPFFSNIRSKHLVTIIIRIIISVVVTMTKAETAYALMHENRNKKKTRYRQILIFYFKAIALVIP